MLTHTQIEALKALVWAGGSGVFLANGEHVLGRGVVLNSDSVDETWHEEEEGAPDDGFTRRTWIALVDAGMCTIEHTRISVTPRGNTFVLGERR